ncbi:hypothetical protein EA58_09635 [Photobacterium galatheae]|uniref:Carrier domain-containing protein n=2 Tax=Photobacterium galatheae TaxID=1654360 RepID=A0A066RWK8_9GAMM|nr:hypothetical protein EA58_09635 [Photobacterium galatheae]
MNLAELLRYCSEHDISLFLSEGKLKVKAPEGILTPELIAELKAQKEAMIAHLSAPQPLLRSGQAGDAPEMSYNQRRLWFIEELGASSQFNLPLALRWEGQVNRQALEQALAVMLERHQVLRTVYRLKDGEPVPVLLPVEDFQITDVDLSGLHDELDVAARVAAEASRPFDLSHEFMLRFHLFHRSPGQQVALINMHHIATDGWSNNIFFHELTGLYNAFAEGAPNPLPALNFQYSDFARWQKSWLSGENLDRHLKFWKRQLKDVPSVHALPLDNKRPEKPTHGGDYYLQFLPVSLCDQLKQLAHRYEVTLFMLLQTAFAVLIGRYSHQRDVVIGSPIANRDQSDFQGLMGFFVNTLLLRTQWQPATRFETLLSENRKVILDAFEYQSIPYEMLLEELKTTRSLSHNALFQVLFVLQNNDTPDDVFFQGIESSFFPFEAGTSQFDLTLGGFEHEGQYSFSWTYATDIFTRETVVRLADSFRQLLEEILEHSHRPVDELNLIPPAQQARLTEPETAPDTDLNTATAVDVVSQIMAQAERTPAAIAVEAGEQHLSYQALIRQAGQLGSRLLAHHIGEGNLVAISLPRSRAMSIAMLAVLGCGAAYLPIDPAMPSARKQRLLEDSGADLLICHDDSAGAGITCLHVDEAAVEGAEAELLSSPVGLAWPVRTIATQATAYVNYTSGTTGNPKGVRISHGNLAHYCRAAQQHYRITPADKVLQTSSFSFDACVEEHFMALIHGATVVYRDDLMLAGWTHFNDFIRRHQVTVAGLPTAVWNELCADADLEAVRPASSLRLMILGGEALLAHQLRRWKTAVGESIQLLNTYGPTETTIVATIFDTAHWDEGHTVPIGRPLASHRCYVLDESGRVVPDGVTGELCIAGPSVAQGYLDPAETEKAFIEQAILPGLNKRCYCTGDRVRLRPDGEIEYLGRQDDQIKLRGYRIELAEIESVISQHASVHQTRVIVHDDPLRGKLLLAYVVCQDGNTQAIRSDDDLWRLIRAELPEYMRPARLIAIDRIPLTVHGKLDRNGLPVPEFDEETDQGHLAATTPTEATLHVIWCDLFQRERISMDAGFFELGGHSLFGVKLIARIKDQMAVELSIRDLFERSTIRELAASIDNNQQTQPEWIDLAVEMAAQGDVKISGIPAEARVSLAVDATEIHQVLLTGSTGFIGAFLLHEVLETLPSARVCCLVRADNEQTGQQRIMANLTRYGLWHPDYTARLQVIPADLSQPNAGMTQQAWESLAATVQWIIHNGAHVNHLLPYSALKPANVDGTTALLRLAGEQRLKLFSFVSAIGTLNPQGEARRLTEQVWLSEETPLHEQRHLAESGYAASKWVAEGMVLQARQQGIPCHIFRLGRVAAHSQTGQCAAQDILARYLQTCRQLGQYPEDEKTEKMIPVDTAVKAMVALSLRQARQPQDFHLIGRDQLGWNQILQYSPWSLKRVPFPEWLAIVGQHSQSDHPLPFSPYWLAMQRAAEASDSGQQPSENLPVFAFSQAKTERLMIEAGVHFPALDQHYCERYLARLDASY